MTANFISSLKAEIAQLEDELRDDPRQRKLMRLREALAEYEPAKRFVLTTEGMIRGSGPPPASKGNKIKAEITALLQQHGHVHRKEILRHLIDAGLMGHEKNAMGSLAAYGSSWNNIFAFDGTGNWSLKKNSESLNL